MCEIMCSFLFRLILSWLLLILIGYLLRAYICVCDLFPLRFPDLVLDCPPLWTGLGLICDFLVKRWILSNAPCDILILLPWLEIGDSDNSCRYFDNEMKNLDSMERMMVPQILKKSCFNAILILTIKR